MTSRLMTVMVASALAISFTRSAPVDVASILREAESSEGGESALSAARPMPSWTSTKPRASRRARRFAAAPEEERTASSAPAAPAQSHLAHKREAIEINSIPSEGQSKSEVSTRTPELTISEQEAARQERRRIKDLHSRLRRLARARGEEGPPRINKSRIHDTESPEGRKAKASRDSYHRTKARREAGLPPERAHHYDQRDWKAMYPGLDQAEIKKIRDRFYIQQKRLKQGDSSVGATPSRSVGATPSHSVGATPSHSQLSDKTETRSVEGWAGKKLRRPRRTRQFGQLGDGGHDMASLEGSSPFRHTPRRQSASNRKAVDSASDTSTSPSDLDFVPAEADERRLEGKRLAMRRLRERRAAIARGEPVPALLKKSWLHDTTSAEGIRAKRNRDSQRRARDRALAEQEGRQGPRRRQRPSGALHGNVVDPTKRHRLQSQFYHQQRKAAKLTAGESEGPSSLSMSHDELTSAESKGTSSHGGDSTSGATTLHLDAEPSYSATLRADEVDKATVTQAPPGSGRLVPLREFKRRRAEREEKARARAAQAAAEASQAAPPSVMAHHPAPS